MSATEIGYANDGERDDHEKPESAEPPESRPKLTYVEYEPGDGHPVWPTGWWAMRTAVAAALAALCIGVGVGVLLALT